MGTVKMFSPYYLWLTVDITVFTLPAIPTLVVAIKEFAFATWSLFFGNLTILILLPVGRLEIYDYMTLTAVHSPTAPGTRS
jgi:hypothetical protein